MKKILLSSLFILCLSTASFGQVSSETTIDENFSELITSSNNFKGYKVVDSEQLTKLQELTSRRIEELKAEITASDESARQLEKEMLQLEAQLADLENQLQEVTSEKDSIAFLGMPFEKATYKNIMWGIVGFLVLALILFVVKFQRSHVHTKEARKNLGELEKEFEAYRAKSLEKEQRLGRMLQDEKNKHMKIAK